jgi:hypothetical protein
LFQALLDIGVGPERRNALRAKLGIESDWPQMGRAGWALVYEAAQKDKEQTT